MKNLLTLLTLTLATASAQIPPKSETLDVNQMVSVIELIPSYSEFCQATAAINSIRFGPNFVKTYHYVSNMENVELNIDTIIKYQNDIYWTTMWTSGAKSLSFHRGYARLLFEVQGGTSNVCVTLLEYEGR